MALSPPRTPTCDATRLTVDSRRVTADAAPATRLVRQGGFRDRLDRFGRVVVQRRRRRWWRFW